MDRSHLNDVCALLIQANAMANNTATFAFSTGPIPPTPLPDLAQLLRAPAFPAKSEILLKRQQTKI